MRYVAEPLPIEDLPPQLFTCTPTRLATWLDCPRRYRFTYVDRPQPQRGPPWAHNSFGASVHTALAAWWRLPLERRTPARVGDLLARGFLTDGYRDDDQVAQQLSRARAMVEAYVATLDPADEPVAIERTVTLKTPVLAASGRVDRLDRRSSPTGDELVIVDYKSGRHILEVADARSSLALALYAMAARQTFRTACRRVELHHLPTGRVLAWTHSDDDLAAHLRQAEQAGTEAQSAQTAQAEKAAQAASSDAADDAHFPPRPAPRCSWCDYVRLCPAGRAAAPVRRPWEGLDT